MIDHSFTGKSMDMHAMKVHTVDHSFTGKRMDVHAMKVHTVDHSCAPGKGMDVNIRKCIPQSAPCSAFPQACAR
eukprot:scaffold248116_cov18-Tisochrysis_lutea.AAC.1